MTNNDTQSSATINEENEDQTTDEPPISIRACLFFDGTRNNRTNIDAKANNTMPKGKGSYEGAYTNIAKLEPLYIKDEEADHSFKFYIEGAGTEDHERDKLRGLAFGTGKTGVKAKVEKGINKIISAIKKLDDTKSIEYIYLDAFGFSRGAASARHFIYAAMTQKKTKLAKRLKELGWSVRTQNIKVKFIGLYDTVASYGGNFSNDTEQLQLRAIQQAEKVVQLASSDEHRENFSLTNINSAGKGIEKFLPGVHSDIGGGYKNASEKDLNILSLPIKYKVEQEERGSSRVPVEDPKATARLEEEKERLIIKGWYKEKDLKVVKIQNNLLANRKVSNEYSRIPLHIMADYAEEERVKFKKELKSAHSIPGDLTDVETKLRGSGGATPGAWDEEPDVIKIRRKYLHFSANYDGFIATNKPRFTDDNKMKGKRERETHDG